MMKNKKRLAILVGTVLCIGLISQVVEKNIDKDAIQAVVTTNLKEIDDHDEDSDYMDDGNTLLEKIGF